MTKVRSIRTSASALAGLHILFVIRTYHLFHPGSSYSEIVKLRDTKKDSLCGSLSLISLLFTL